MSKKNITLLIIDPQIDFCQPPGDPLSPLGAGIGGALYVGGAENDMARLATMMRAHGDKIDNLRVTLDSHQRVHVAHPICWQDRNGNHPAPFTFISLADIKSGVWRATNPALQKRFTRYLEQLEANKRYPLIIWNPHCLIGTLGTAVLPVIRDAIYDSFEGQHRLVDWVTKGSFFGSEHYGVVKADVPDPSVPETQVNTRLVQALQESDDVLVAGEALSHCVANSVRDIAELFGPQQVSKIVLLTDATSPVGNPPGTTLFTDMADAFVKEMTAKGMRTSTTTTFFN